MVSINVRVDSLHAVHTNFAMKYLKALVFVVGA